MSDDIHIRITGNAGRITLTRPDALNAMTYDMCLAIGEALERWRNDQNVKLVVIDAEGSKSFCAGGDIAELYRTGRAGDYEYGRKFWRDEYRINAKIKRYPKPYVALMDGIVMGGGVGISAHGSHRIVTENTMFAMPECGIGLVPDVGGNWLLSRAPGLSGEYLATTGARLGAADCIHAGIADTYIPEDRLGELVKRLETDGDLSAITELAETAPDGELAANQDKIDTYFRSGDMAAIVAKLEASDGEWEKSTAKLVRRNCPLSVACAAEIVKRSRNAATIEEVLALEYRFTWRSMETGDFLEGIRAQIIDKDRSPNWNPARLEAIDKPAVEAMLAPLGKYELDFPS